MSTVTLATVISDLVAEQDALDAIVAPLNALDWELATPSPRWAIRDQIGHLAFFDKTAALAITNPEEFINHRSEFSKAAIERPSAGDELTLGAFRTMTADELLTHWRNWRTQLATAAASCGEKDRVDGMTINQRGQPLRMMDSQAVETLPVQTNVVVGIGD